MAAAGEWLWSLDYEQPVRVIEQQIVWGEPVAQVWVPRTDAVVQTPTARLVPIQDRPALTANDLVWQASAARILDALGRDTLVAPSEANVIPLPHQIQALARSVSGDRVRFLLADEVGLGKTIEAGLILRELKIRGLVRRILVVAPAGLVGQWADEMRLRFNERFHLVLPSWFSVLRGAGGLAEDANVWRLHDQVVCPMDAVKPVETRRGWSAEDVARHNRERFEDLVSAGWDLIIVDEAHRLGGSTDQVARFKLGDALAQAAPYLLLLTATPHQGKTDGFRRLLTFLDEQAFGPDLPLTRELVAPYVIRTEKRQAIGTDGQPLFKPRKTVLHPVAWENEGEQKALYEAVSEYVRLGYDQARTEKRNAIGFLMLLMQRLVTSSTRAIRSALERRRDVLELPDGQLSLFGEDIEELWTDLDGQVQMETALKSRLKAIGNERAEVELLLSAARRCEARGPDVKALGLLDWLSRVERDEQDPRLKVLIFTEFVPTQAMLREFLEARGYSVVCLNGSMGLDERRDVQRAFAGDVRILVSTDAGGEGLNLQFCHVVVNYDLPWNPMKLEQRIGRVDRIGQSHPVLAINMALEGSVELRVREVLEEKLARILAEFGSDKLGDVLDSELAGGDFEIVYARALSTPDAVPELVDELAARVRQQFAVAKRATDVLGRTEVDPSVAEQVGAPQLNGWVEQMTVAYLGTQGSNGGRAVRTSDGWNLLWPDGTADACVTFGRTPDGSAEDVLTMEDARVRSILERLAPLSPALPIPTVAIPGVSDKVAGDWSLWRVSLHHGDGRDQLFLPLFVDEDGRVLQPAARLIWERLTVGQFEVLTDVSHDPQTLRGHRLLAEERGADLLATLVNARRERVNRERRAGERGLAARRRTIERLGLPQGRQKRLETFEQEERQWARRMNERQRTAAGLDPVLLLQVTAYQGSRP